METSVAYGAKSAVTSEGGATALHLSPNVLRDDTHLVARLAEPLAFRDALLALHDVARSELYVPAEEIERRQLDPVVTVAPGEVYFESFSLDESTYGRVSVRERALADIEKATFGTTNVEFSEALRQGLESIRSGTRVGLRVARSGIALEAGARSIEETKIDLADSWVHGFLAVQASIRRPAVTLALHPGDLRNIITYLKGRKETRSPRSLRFQLARRKPPSVVAEPWDETIELERSKHDAKEDREVRIWGRRRLLLLQKALPGAKAARAVLQGSGLPSFWTVDHGSISITLGLSPWTERDWAGLEPFSLGADADPGALALVEKAALFLEEKRRATASLVAAAIGVEEGAARTALDGLCSEGRALFDPEGDAWVARRIFTGTPPPPPASAERAKAARAIVEKGGVTLADTESSRAGALARGTRVIEARVKGNGTYDATAVLDSKGALVRGICSCPFFSRMGLERGACKHLLALALAGRDAR